MIYKEYVFEFDRNIIELHLETNSGMWGLITEIWRSEEVGT